MKSIEELQDENIEKALGTIENAIAFDNEDKGNALACLELVKEKLEINKEYIKEINAKNKESGKLTNIGDKIEKQVDNAFNKIINELDLEFGYEGLKDDVSNILEPLKKDIAILLNENSELKKQLNDTKKQLIDLQINDDALLKEKNRIDEENQEFREFIKMADKLAISITYILCCDSFVDYNQKIKSLTYKREQINHTQFRFLKKVLRKIW